MLEILVFSWEKRKWKNLSVLHTNLNPFKLSFFKSNEHFLYGKTDLIRKIKRRRPSRVGQSSLLSCLTGVLAAHLLGRKIILSLFNTFSFLHHLFFFNILFIPYSNCPCIFKPFFICLLDFSPLLFYTSLLFFKSVWKIYYFNY